MNKGWVMLFCLVVVVGLVVFVVFFVCFFLFVFLGGGHGIGVNCINKL